MAPDRLDPNGTQLRVSNERSILKSWLTNPCHNQLKQAQSSGLNCSSQGRKVKQRQGLGMGLLALMLCLTTIVNGSCIAKLPKETPALYLFPDNRH